MSAEIVRYKADKLLVSEIRLDNGSPNLKFVISSVCTLFILHRYQ